MMIWSDFEFVIHIACIIKTRILNIIYGISMGNN